MNSWRCPMGRRLAILILLLGVAGTLLGAEWYRSGAAGGLGAPILSSAPASEGWSISVERTDETEVRTLYEDGQKRSSVVFFRTGGRLVAREERDAADEVLSRVEYAWDADGNPRAVFISLEDRPSGSGDVEGDRRVNADAALWRHTSGRDGDWTITDRDAAGRPLERRSIEDGAQTRRSTWRRDEDGRLLEQIDEESDGTIRKRYDPQGRLVDETTTRDGRVALLRSYSWDGPNLVRVEERGEGRLVVREIQWRGGRMTGEIRSIDGVVVSETVWRGDDERVETLYRDGVPVVRVLWVGGVKRREEFLKDGAVIRTREIGS